METRIENEEIINKFDDLAFEIEERYIEHDIKVLKVIRMSKAERKVK